MEKQTLDNSPGPTPVLEAYYRQSKLWDLARYEGNTGERLRARVIAAMVDPDTESVLDVGCGNGFVTRHLRAQRVVGLDPSPEALEQFNGEKVLGRADALPFPDHSFDAVVCTEVLEHLPESVYTKAVKEFARVARTSIIVGVPFDEDLRSGMTRCGSCGRVYHVNLHCRSFSGTDDLEAVFPGFITAYVAYVGRYTMIRSRIFRTVRYCLCGPSCHNTFAQCPECKQPSTTPGPRGFVRRHVLDAFARIAWRLPKKSRPTWLMATLIRDKSIQNPKRNRRND